MSERVILHSDMNCFYASVEMLHHPEFAGMPLAVGGNPEARHGIMAGETGLPGNYFCTTKDGFVFAIFTNGKRNLFRVYRQN